MPVGLINDDENSYRSVMFICYCLKDNSKVWVGFEMDLDAHADFGLHFPLLWCENDL